LSPRTKAIMAVHLYGLPCNMYELKEIAEEHNLLLIEDCAEALGSFIGSRHVGFFGDISTFSFYGNKTITTGEGGMVVTANPSLAERVRHLKGQGLAKYREYWHDVIGYNYRMTNLCAAIGCAQLESIERKLARKKEIADLYRKNLAHLTEFQAEIEGMRHSHWMVSCLVEKATSRDGLRESLKRKGIETRPVFYPIHSMPMYARSFRRMPVADDIASRGLNLPSYPTLENSQVLEVCNAVEEFLTDGRMK
jgi:perosamine synthetase